ncbi:carbamoyltransferase HypF [Methanosphaera sp. WGK6]|uniref:carbamoyltransferase HypF n=1 Tax=Methanosphaera sp. WGK6 TaxID=1561964 RepID=UPI00084BCBAB|nr:carbamoyltransferase HypF [Methanosphaera sp. WGK6]OED29694.1 transcriptional regulator [Methanosphaera sp. WGK6]
MKEYTAQLLVDGIVQGVGFRPTVYRLAKVMNLTGYVRNMGNIVEILIQGTYDDIQLFVDELQEHKPIRSEINSINLDIREEVTSTTRYNDFTILNSSDELSGSAVIPPDMTICDECLEEIVDLNNHHYYYPFTACTNCGPRFTVIDQVPYDRKNTTMDEFPLCNHCAKEYSNPLDRRYHAEATCCPDCGPQVFLYNDEHIPSQDPIRDASKLIDEGNILAIKGIGGTHLVCKTSTDDAIDKLRERLGRKTQPFACMTPDVETAKLFVEFSDDEKKMLESVSRPIVILNKSQDYNLSENLSPNLHNQGVMLPYTGLHHLLFKYTLEPAYVMTSANMPGNPMLIDNKEILSKLDNIADYYLLHDRKILNRCDDSVVRFRNGKPGFIRRSRGYVPKPFDFSKINNTDNILAVGPELDVTFSILKEGKCYPSQHIGNTSKIRTLEFMQDAIKHLLKLTRTDSLNYIVADMHPEFNTTKLAKQLSEEYDAQLVQVQHHHAHASSLMAEHQLPEMVVIAADGVGYGEDGNIWGGEILYLNNTGHYINHGGLQTQPMPGGDLSTKYPIRMAMGILYGVMDSDELGKLMKSDYADYFKYGEQEVDMVLKQLENDFNTSKTSSMGRVLDSISVLLGISKNRGYEGECSMKLESVAREGFDLLNIDLDFEMIDDRAIINTSNLLLDVVQLIKSGVGADEIACACQRALAEALTEIAIIAAKSNKTSTIGVTGGVFYNEFISKVVKEKVISAGFEFVQHEATCAGDGSVSMGQCAIVGWRNSSLNELI